MPGGSAGLAESRITIEREREIGPVGRMPGLVVDQLLFKGEKIVERSGPVEFASIEFVAGKDAREKPVNVHEVPGSLVVCRSENIIMLSPPLRSGLGKNMPK